MKLAKFWKLIAKVSDSKTPAMDIAAILVRLPPSEIESYKWHFENLCLIGQRLDLFHAATLLTGWCDEAEFTDFLSGLISKGKKTYETALKKPDSLAVFWKDPDISNDAFCYMASRAYKQVTGHSLPDSCFDVPGKYPAKEQKVFPLNEEWDAADEAENRKHLPKLSELYYSQPNIKTDGFAILSRARHSLDTLEKTYEIIKMRRK
jgi:hypothetical protein